MFGFAFHWKKKSVVQFLPAASSLAERKRLMRRLPQRLMRRLPRLPAGLHIEDCRLEATLPPLKTQEEYAKEAREQRPFVLRFITLRKNGYAALWSRKAVETRYIRQRQYSGQSKFWTIFFERLSGLFFALPFTLGLGWYMSTAGNQNLSTSYTLTETFIYSFCIIAPLSFIATELLVLLTKMKFAYAPTVLFAQHASTYDLLAERKAEVQRILGKLKDSLLENPNARRLSLIGARISMYSPYLAWIDKSERGIYLAGARTDNAQGKAEIRLQMPAGMSVSDLQANHEVIYDWYPRVPMHEGNTSRFLNQFLNMWIRVADMMKAELGEKKVQKFVKDNWPLLLVAGEIIVIMVLLDRASTFTDKVVDIARQSADVSVQGLAGQESGPASTP